VRRGDWSDHTEKFPLVIGADGAGIIVDAGADVPTPKGRGLDVWAYEFGNRKGGFYAEYAAVDADHIAPRPKELTMIEAAASATSGLTALQGIDDHIQLTSRETILIFGATGALGTLAVQFAKRHGAYVIGTASSAGGEQTLRDLGATHVLDARAPNAVERLRAYAPEGLNAILALAGGDVLEKFAQQLVENGRLAYPNGVTPEPRKRSRVRTIAYDAVATPEKFEQLNRAVAESHLKAVIAKTYKLEEAAQAHERLEQGQVIGRIALQIR
jgi:NADPH:quinone reductase-like Zn-dependent oxidoreductase